MRNKQAFHANGSDDLIRKLRAEEEAAISRLPDTYFLHRWFRILLIRMRYSRLRDEVRNRNLYGRNQQIHQAP